MRIIHRVSFSIFLIDIASKLPIQNASILCNGKQNPYTHKADGHYVFSNLQPDDYEISISCPGYVNMKFNIKTRDNETKKIILDMPYDSSNVSIKNIYRLTFILNMDEKVDENENITVVLKNPINSLNLAKNFKKNEYFINFNNENDSQLFPQKYIYVYENIKTKIFITGYNSDIKSYVLGTPLENDILEKGKFYVYWELKKDNKNKIIIPYIQKFMDEIPKLSFVFLIKDKKYQTIVNTKKFEKNKEIISNVKRKIKKIPF